MTLFLDFRIQDVGGPVSGPRLCEGDGTAAPLSLPTIPPARVAGRLAGRDLLFVAHGFNNSRPQGAYALGTLDGYLNLPPPGLMIGVLWPGDCWLPLVDYPFEGDVAEASGKRLAGFCNDLAGQVRSFSFASHSLGARLVLEALGWLTPQARTLCLTAGAINRDCLTAQYAASGRNAGAVSALASRKDWVLKVAFSLGDPLADLLEGDHTPFQAALGRFGPRAPVPGNVAAPWQIPDAEGYDHGNYLPPTAPPRPGAPPPGPPWQRPADFIRRAFLGRPQTWPPL